MKSLLIKDTTKEEREAIVAESLAVMGVRRAFWKCTSHILTVRWSCANVIWHSEHIMFREKNSRSETVVDMSGKQYDNISIW